MDRFPRWLVFSDQWGRFSHGSEVSPKPFRSNPGSLQKTLRIRSQLRNLKFHKNIRAHGIHSLPTLETGPSRASGKLSIVRRTNPSRYRVNQLIFEVNSKLIHRKCQQQSNIVLRNWQNIVETSTTYWQNIGNLLINYWKPIEHRLTKYWQIIDKLFDGWETLFVAPTGSPFFIGNIQGIWIPRIAPHRSLHSPLDSYGPWVHGSLWSMSSLPSWESVGIRGNPWESWKIQ